jgi:hypothetical protein
MNEAERGDVKLISLLSMKIASPTQPLNHCTTASSFAPTHTLTHSSLITHSHRSHPPLTHYTLIHSLTYSLPSSPPTHDIPPPTPDLLRPQGTRGGHHLLRTRPGLHRHRLGGPHSAAVGHQDRQDQAVHRGVRGRAR